MIQYIILILIFLIFTYIAIKDWQTGLISIPLNFILLGFSVLYAVLERIPISDILIRFLLFVLPFILIEAIFQIFFNKEKDENRFLIGGGDIILFASISLILSAFGMIIMFFLASLGSVIVSGILKIKRVPFAPFLEIGLIIAYFFSENIMNGLINSILYL